MTKITVPNDQKILHYGDESIAGNTVSRFFKSLLLSPWQASKFVVSKMLRKFGNTSVLAPSKQVPDEKDENYKQDIEAIKQAKFDIIRSTVPTYDGAELDTFEIKHPKNEKLAKDKQQYIIYFSGQASSYEKSLREMMEEAEINSCHVIGFNYRGVGKSKGFAKNKDDLVKDGIAQVQNLIKSGIKIENILLHGHSLGGAVATLVAEHFYYPDKNKRVIANKEQLALFNDRSFSNLANAFMGQFTESEGVRDGNGYDESIFKKVIGWLVRPVIKTLLVLTNWEMEAADSYNTLPKKRKDLLVVRSPHEVRSPEKEEKLEEKESKPKIKDDSRVTNGASLFKAVYSKLKAKAKKNGDLAAVKQESKTKKVISIMQKNPHKERLSQLQNRSGGTGLDIFATFFQGLHPDHERNIKEAEALEAATALSRAQP